MFVPKVGETSIVDTRIHVVIMLSRSLFLVPLKGGRVAGDI